MTNRQYLNSHLMIGQVEVSEIIPGEPPVLRTRATWFHPKGGGQKSDQGAIGTARVLQVTENCGEIDHGVDSVEGFEVGKEYSFAIDREVRILNAGYHTAGHLLANLLEGRHPMLRSVKGHHWPGEARVVFEGDLAHPIDLAALNATIASLLEKGLPVAIVGNPGSIRAIRIGEFPPIPCGGVHLQSLAELQSLTVTRLKQKEHTVSVHYDVQPKP